MATLNVKYQHRLQGPPSSHASTHIYDGFISKIKTCGFDISQVLRFKKLVRIGGGCCEPELEQYRERDGAFSDVSVRQVLHRIESYQGQRDEWIKSSKSTPMLTNKDFAALFDGTKHYETSRSAVSVDIRGLPSPCVRVCPRAFSECFYFCQEHSCKFLLGCPDGVVRKRLYCEILYRQVQKRKSACETGLLRRSRVLCV
ncbi:hypothetical protein PI124_g16672 [Phytophthora idaei]|nr:hypothetical protein PI126_g16179 [Phytophthora idaei]KAG3238370.1 hypothetical protein PI124_g16672 [Phytophthora idaei]